MAGLVVGLQVFASLILKALLIWHADAATIYRFFISRQLQVKSNHEMPTGEPKDPLSNLH